MKEIKHPIFMNLALLTHIIESEFSDPISIELAEKEREKIIVECWLN